MINFIKKPKAIIFIVFFLALGVSAYFYFGREKKPLSNIIVVQRGDLKQEVNVTGGMLGIILGALFSFLVSVVLSRIISIGWVFVFPVSAALLGLAVSSTVGLVFGLYPARQASIKSPIEALRYE